MNNFIAIPKQNLLHQDNYICHIPGYVLLEESQNFCVLIKDTIYNSQFASLDGQINRSSNFGKLLYQTALNPMLTKWLEIGTWNGKGTTTCILDGFRDAEKDSSKLISYEANNHMYMMAIENLKNHSYYKNVILHNGRIPNSNPFTLANTLEKSDFYKRFYDSEKYLYNEANQIAPEFSPQVVVLDGAEYTGMLDFESVPKDDLKIIFLDDVNCDKNKKVVNLLKSDSNWIQHIKEDERNGWACFLHKSLLV